MPTDSGITRIDDHAAQAVALLPTSHTRTRWTRLLQGLLGADTSSALQELESVFWDLLTLRRLATATGLQLDGLGELLGLTRDGLDDDDYREALGLAASSNVSAGSVEQIISAADSLTTIASAQLHEVFPHEAVLYLHGSALTVALRRLLRVMAREAVRLDLVSSGGSRPFVFGPDGGSHGIVSISGTTVTVLSDVTDRYSVGDRVRVIGLASELVELDNATVVSVGLVVTNTQIVLTKSYTGSAPSGTNPLILENMDHGLQDADGFGGEDAYAIAAVNPATRTVSVGGTDATSEWTAGQRLEIVGSTGNDGAYSVVSATWDAIYTRIVVGEALPSAVADGQLHHLSPALATAMNEDLTEGDDSPHGELADAFEE